MQGVTRFLATPEDLFGKMKNDYNAFKNNPGDPYLAFNFFVTAEHMPDWIGKPKIRSEYSILKVLSHVANTAKHYKVTRKSHIHVEKMTSWQSSQERMDEGKCVIQVFISEQSDFPEKGWVDGTYIARLVIEFWGSYLNASPSN